MGDSFESFHKFCMGCGPEHGDNDLDALDSFDRDMRFWTDNRRFIVLDSKFIGWAPAKAQVGDSVYVFPGARMPYVVRWKKPAALSALETMVPQFSFVNVDSALYRDTANKEYELVGQSYIHGLMDRCENPEDVRASRYNCVQETIWLV